MKTQNTETPSILNPSLIEEACAFLPGAWLEPLLAPASAHWRLLNEPAVKEADTALRALFLLAYRKIDEPKPRSGDFPQIISMADIDFSAIPSRRQSTDDRYGEGFYAEARAHSQTLVDRAPGTGRLDLLSGLSEFLRFEVPKLSNARGSATRVLEAVWEDMDIGWYN